MTTATATNSAPLTATDIYPTGHKVLVQLVEQEGITKGGIIIPEVAKKKPLKGIVMRTGPQANVVQEQQLVHFDVYTGIPVAEGLLMIKQEDILAVQEEV